MTRKIDSAILAIVLAIILGLSIPILTLVHYVDMKETRDEINTLKSQLQEQGVYEVKSNRDITRINLFNTNTDTVKLHIVLKWKEK